MDPRNVLNIAETDRVLDDLAALIERPELKGWLRGPVRLWLLGQYDRFDRVIRDPATGGPARVDAGDEWDTVPRPLTDELPAPIDAALARGETVVYLRLGTGLQKRVARVLEALVRELDRAGPEALDGLSFPAAEALDRARRRAAFQAGQRGNGGASRGSERRISVPAPAVPALPEPPAEGLPVPPTGAGGRRGAGGPSALPRPARSGT